MIADFGLPVVIHCVGALGHGPKAWAQKRAACSCKGMAGGERCALSSRATTKPGRKSLGPHVEDNVRLSPAMACVCIKLRHSNATFPPEN